MTNGFELPEDGFVYFSELLRLPVLSADGTAVGKLVDLIAEASAAPYPLIRSIRLRRGRRDVVKVLWSGVGELTPRHMSLKADCILQPIPTVPGGISLANDVLDRQIVDTHGAKVKRVNDLHLLWTRRELRLAHVDVGMRGLVRRLGWQRFADALVRVFSPKAAYLVHQELVSWKHVRPVGSGSSRIQLSVARDSLSQVHPADLVEILEDLDRPERAILFRELPVETAADALEEAEPDLQRELLESVAPERAADLIEAMEPDDAADLLGELPRDQSAELLSEMDPREARDVEQLLGYKPNSAGGMMTSDFLKVNPETTVEQVVEDIRQRGNTFKPVHDVFLLAPDGKLRGSVSLRDLLLADRKEQLQALAREHPAALELGDSAGRAAELATKYNLLSLPVQDSEGKILGVVTVDDVLERAVHG